MNNEKSKKSLQKLGNLALQYGSLFGLVFFLSACETETIVDFDDPPPPNFAAGLVAHAEIDPG